MITLSYAVLGLLARAPMSGYDLLQRLENPVGYFWHARRSQIYPELARLEADGLVTSEAVEQRDRPAKRVYQLTEVGRATLRDWVETPMGMQPDRDVFMLKIYSVWLAAPHQALRLVRNAAKLHRGRLEEYEATRLRMEDGWPVSARRLDSPKFAAYATLRRGVDYERGFLEWCDWLLGVIENEAEAER